ncbi:MAG: NAD(P)-binding protein [Bacilli bacterium]|nr:NAD(P)-binding protein [Bacilli bacterium]
MIRVRQVKVSIKKDNKENILKKISTKLKINSSEILNYKIVKKSLDARDKKNIFFVYEFDVCLKDEKKIHLTNDIFIVNEENYKFEITGKEKLNDRIVIVGSGPSGLFCAYMLAEAGYKPLIIEQGEMIEDRIKTVEEFFKTNKLNPNSNVQFGEGGAGTFSDGKLNTLIKDKLNRGKKVFEIFVEAGAPEEIMYLNKPHIGTDILRKVIINIRKKIISMGGEFKYNTKLTDLVIEDDKISAIEVNNKDIINCSVLVLAIGHSARDTFKLLHDKNVLMKAKNFAVGVRIEHPQEMISKSQYGDSYKLLEPASYKLTYQTKSGRGVYSFCMCPGGFVVNASSEEGRLVVNGMSNYKRDEENANSALVVTVTASDFGNDPLAGVEFQRKLEERAYNSGNGKIPVQLYKDFVSGTITKELGNVVPNTKGEFCFADLNEVLPGYITESLKEAIPSFDKKIKGFARSDAVLLGVESRTSSPVIIVRNEFGISNVSGIYPCGEGAGYAGGITTAAIDGIKVFENIIRMYKI